MNYNPGTKPAHDPGKPGSPSEPLYGLSKADRSITVIPFNNQDDFDLMASNTVSKNKLRYIDDYNVNSNNTLGDRSYWNENTNVLNSSFNAYKDTHSDDENAVIPEPNKKAEGDYTQDNGHKVNITIKDYSD